MKHNESYMQIAKIVANRSYCKRKQVGAIIVKDNQIISDGYNGTPTGFPNICEIDNVTVPEVLHAESNALMKLCQSHNSSKDAIMFVTCSPCYECSKLIIQSGIKKVYYSELYRNTEGLELLKKANIEIEQI